MMKLYNGDCLDIMDKLIEEGFKADSIITDPPYGTTKCKWDTVIPLDLMWERINKLIKPNGAIVLFGSEPFSSVLRMSNLKGYKYDLVWKKSKCGSAFTAKHKPLTKHENISIFEKTGKKTTYNPQMTEGKPYKRNFTPHKKNDMGFGIKGASANNTGTRHPSSVLDFPQKWRRQDQVHTAQKPVPLMEWLVRSYTNENEVVLDFAMGSGSTGVACRNLNRGFVGIEIDEDYFNVAKERCQTESR